MITEHKVVEAWLAASRDLGITVIAPFTLSVNGRDQEYLAHIPDFGGGKGIVVASLPYDSASYAFAKSMNYRCSFVNVEMYRIYDRAFFIETLTEWGFTGSYEARPAWLPSPPA